jgi:molybdopterin molybdotransferase
MISEQQARAKILDALRPLPTRKISIVQALDSFAAEDYFARFPLPMFDNSAMDGYAVIAKDCSPRRIRPSADKIGARLRVVGEQPAGVDRKLCVSSGEAVRIFTGAPMPAGGDAVVMQEDVARDGDEVVVNADVEVDQFIRKRGCDLSEGQKIIVKGERLNETKIALLASQGFEEVAVGGEMRAAIISTGDELAKPGEELRAGQIYDSNSILLQSLLQRCGAVVASNEHCRDDAESLGKVFQAATKNEILIVSGGVSVGEHDLVQSTLRDLGAKIDIWRVAIKPGKPFLFGRLRDCFVFGLPGNPVSAFVTFLQFVRPAILKMMGAANVEMAKVLARLDVDLTNEGDRAHYIRGRLENGLFAPIGRQESHALFGLSQANALLRMEAGESLKAGDRVNVEIF